MLSVEIIEKVHSHNHYDFIDRYGAVFEKALNMNNIQNLAQNTIAHGDKCYSYRDTWYAMRIPFPIGVMVYLLSHYLPFSEHVRNTRDGWIAPVDWVVIACHASDQDPLYGRIKRAIAATYRKFHDDQQKLELASIDDPLVKTVTAILQDDQTTNDTDKARLIVATIKKELSVKDSQT